MLRTTKWSLAAALALAACGGSDKDAPGGGQATRGQAPVAAAPTPPPPPPPPEVRLEVDVKARQLTVYRKDQPVAHYGVAVGRPEWPTQNGEWTIGQVIWNPRWTPPVEEEWAEDEEVKEPGDPENPLGRVQLVYDAPRTIHGTNEPESIGTAASHGSLRMKNEEAIELAKLVMEAGGAARDESWIAEAQRNRTRRYEVVIPNPIPIRVINGAANANAVEGERSGGSSDRSAPARRDTGTAARSDTAEA